jgi:leucyl aminopeptidase
MHPVFTKSGDGQTIPILFVNAASFGDTVKKIDDREQVYVRATGYEPKPGRHLIVPKADGTLAGVLFGIEPSDAADKDLLRPGLLATLLPPGTYRFANAAHDARLAALAVALGSYQFTRYRKGETRDVQLVVPDGVDGEDLSRIVEGVTSSIRRRTTWGRTSWKKPPGRSRQNMARPSTSPAAIRWPRIFR